ncbi:MAG TPA: hypothetical protein DCO77_00150 [Nitrospiraceae bacterium]|nr:hypothetical protein [Nitrospiraceae bacterium]
MRVTPLDIQQKKFHIGVRGYDRKEVDAFLDLIREEMEELIREVTEHREFRQSYDEKQQAFLEKEDMLKNTMLTTNKLVEDFKDNARKEAEVILKDADVRSQRLVDTAQRENAKLEADILNLRRQRHYLLQDMKKVIQTHLEMINFAESTLESRNEPAPK